jgi:hypothetical protein
MSFGVGVMMGMWLSLQGMQGTSDDACYFLSSFLGVGRLLLEGFTLQLHGTTAGRVWSYQPSRSNNSMLARYLAHAIMLFLHLATWPPCSVLIMCCFELEQGPSLPD